jgi:hypothetical protein
VRIRSVFSHSAQAIAEGALISLLVVGLMAGTAFAGKPAVGTGGHKGGGGATGTGSFSLVVNSPDGLPHYNQNYTFKVTSTATYPFVRDDCYQNGTLVYSQYEGFYSGWLWGTDFIWWSSAWTGGAADCTATLYSTDSTMSTKTTLATMSIHVSP